MIMGRPVTQTAFASCRIPGEGYPIPHPARQSLKRTRRVAIFYHGARAEAREDYGTNRGNTRELSHG